MRASRASFPSGLATIPTSTAIRAEYGVWLDGVDKLVEQLGSDCGSRFTAMGELTHPWS